MEFKLSKIPEGAKVTLKKSLMQVWKTTRVKPKELADQINLPFELHYLWRWFAELKTKEILDYTEILAWCSLKNIKLKTWEIETLMTLEKLWANS